jgi:hypothetical protein
MENLHNHIVIFLCYYIPFLFYIIIKILEVVFFFSLLRKIANASVFTLYVLKAGVFNQAVYHCHTHTHILILKFGKE